MPENMRMSTLNQEMTRRMMNTSEMVPMEQRVTVVDDYGQKLTDSGYGIDQIRRVIRGHQSCINFFYFPYQYS